MLAALLWWAILLHRKNHEAFVLQTQLMEQKHASDQGVQWLDITTLPEYKEMQAHHQRQMYMIFGEALVFGLTLVIGIYFINRAYVRELASTEKQKNFLLSITHELKSPLASINLILSTFIKRDLPADKVKELSEDGLKESTRLEELFNKILISTRLDKTYPFNYEEANLSELINTTIDRFQNIHPEAQIKRDVSPKVIHKVDQESMVSVVKNLLENALKYSPNKKEIEIKLHQSSGSTNLIIADKGVGIPKDERGRIFDQFYRVGSEETRETKGTGLGLYIVYQIVTAHGGKINVEDNLGGGTKFRIQL